MKAAFKNSELGPLPEDWECQTIRDAASRTSNAIVGGPFGSDLVSADYVSSGIPVIRGQNMSHGLVAGDFVFVSPEKARSLNANLARPSDLVFTQRGTLGQVSLVPYSAFDYYLISQSQMKVSLDPSRHDPSFVQQYFLSAAGQKQVLDSAIQTGVPHTNLGILRAYNFPAPPLAEQKAIATVLSDVDALLGALDRLIAKKRDLKQAAMQQLLTGQTRLPGFSGKWEDTTIGTLGSWFSGGTPSKGNETYWTGDIPWVSPKDMKRARILDAIDHVGQSAIGNGTRLLPTGAILIVVRGMILAHSAPVARVERAVAFNQDIKGLVVRSGIDSNFVLWWLVAHEALLLSLTNEATHGTKRIPTNELLKLKLRVPLLEEQAAIAGAISDMDAELTALEQRRDKTRLLKQGMMQELLTGRTRLV